MSRLNFLAQDTLDLTKKKQVCQLLLCQCNYEVKRKYEMLKLYYWLFTYIMLLALSLRFFSSLYL